MSKTFESDAQDVIEFLETYAYQILKQPVSSIMDQVLSREPLQSII